MIITGPENITVNRDEADFITFNVTFNFPIAKVSDEEFTYQWQRNGSNLVERPGKFEGVDTSVLTIRDAQNEDEDSYRCVIFNGAGDSVISNEAFLSVGKLL